MLYTTMIHVELGPVPAALRNAEFRRHRQELEEFFSVPPGEREKLRFNFASVSRYQVVAAIRKAFHGRCAYCESPIEEGSRVQIDSFRPKQRAMGLDGQVDEDHYWWLAYEWTNLRACCMTCNRLKASRFPVEGPRAVPGAVGKDLDEERRLLLDPCSDYPEEHLLFNDQGQVASSTLQGRTTIDVLGLNREDLVFLRKGALKNLLGSWQQLSGPLTAPETFVKTWMTLDPFDSPFRAMRRQFLQQWSREAEHLRSDLRQPLQTFLGFRTALPPPTRSRRSRVGLAVQQAVEKTFEDYSLHVQVQESYSVEAPAGLESYYAKTRLIERVEIRNFKGIRDLNLVLPPVQSGGTCLLLLGENGTGKSSILQAVALALMGRQHHERLGLDPRDYLTEGEDSGHVYVHLTGSPEPVRMTFSLDSGRFDLKPEDPKVLLLGYGSTRLLPRPGSTPVEKFGASKADNLFSPFVPLEDADRWLCGLEPDELRRMEEGLKQLLPLGYDEARFFPGGSPPRIQVEMFGSRVSLDRLSDGYQSVVALATDVMSVMKLRWPEMELAEGIVLIDEIDAHLHPRWKMQVVDRLRKVFPRLQFLMTSHDPLCLRGLRAGEVAVMRRDLQGGIHVLTDLPSPEGLRVDQILTSEFFGLNSTRSPEDDQLFAEYYALLAERKPSAAQRKRLAELKKQLEGRDLLGTTPRERLMLEAADRFVAQARVEENAGEREALAEDVRQKIADLWASVPPLKPPSS
jgi:uncharacterized protein (TIGR02646 family)